MANQFLFKIVCGVVILFNVSIPTIKSESNAACGPADSGLFYPHPDCTKYYACGEGGQEFIRDCPPGTYWNQDNSQCDHPENVAECVGGTRPPSGGSTSNPPISSTEPTTTTTPPNTSSNTTPSTTPASTATTETTSPTPLPNGCPLEGIDKIPYPGSCVLYLICIDGNPYVTNCTDGLYFNPDTKECDLPENVNCTASEPGLFKSVPEDLVSAHEKNFLITASSDLKHVYADSALTYLKFAV